MMLEIGIFCVILLAAGYWATMFAMGRRADVLHGKFVHPDPEAETGEAPAPAAPPFPPRPVFPKRPSPRVAGEASEQRCHGVAAGGDQAGLEGRRVTGFTSRPTS